MSAIEIFIKSKSKSLKYWIILFWNNLNNSEEVVDESWKKIKLKSSYYPPLFPLKGGENSIFNYLELNSLKENKIWKRN